MKPLDYDLGIFDPTFPGITIHFPTEDAWRHQRELDSVLVSASLEDLIKDDPSLATTTLDRQVVQRLLQRNAGNALSAEERERLGQLVIDQDPDNAAVSLALSSVFEHERRHFHDFLLSPWAASLAVMRLEVCLNFPAIFRALTPKGITVIPVPLTRWLIKSEVERKELIGMWQGMVGDSFQVRTPDVTSPELLNAIEQVARRYRSLRVLFDPIESTDISVIGVFEASALLIQTQAIHDSLGATASNRFLETITERRAGSPYSYALSPMGQFLRAGEVLEVRVLSTLVTWCLLGFNNADIANANPLVRFNHMVSYLKDNGFPSVSRPAREIFDELDQYAKAVPFAECLSSSMNFGDRFIDQLEGEMTQYRGQALTFVHTALQSYANIHAWHKELASAFLEDPDRYATPDSYLDENLDLWPEPPIRTIYGRPFYCIPRNRLSEFDDVLFFEEESNSERAFIRQHVMQMPKKRVEYAVAKSWQQICGSTDLVFADFNRDHPEVEYQRETGRKAGLYFMEVLA